MTNTGHPWAELDDIAAAFDTHPDPHGMIHLPAVGIDETRFVLVDYDGGFPAHDGAFRVGLYETDRDLALVLIEVDSVDAAIAAAQTLTRSWVQIG